MSEPTPSPAAPAACALPLSPAEIDASLRLPVSAFFLTSAIWLVVASVLGLIASLKLLAPEFLADCPVASYGRVQPAALNALVYGFALPAAFGVALWIICRLGRTKLGNPLAVFISGQFWNLGVTLGLLGIFSGDSTGHELLEMPGSAWAILFWSGALICGSALLALHERRERELHISQMFLLAALFWFPWIYSGANTLLHCVPARGVMQAVAAWWFANNLLFVCFGCFGLAAIYYFLPKAYQRPLAGRDLALTGFWLFLFFGSWCGIPAGAPVPAWLISVSTVAGFLCLVPVLIVASLVWNIWRTATGRTSLLKASPERLFFSLAAIIFVLASLRHLALGARGVSELLGFTYFLPGQQHAVIYGFFGLAMFGSIYHIVPKLTGREWPSTGLIKLHFWTAAVGTVIIVLSLSVAGLRTGVDLSNLSLPFLAIAKSIRTQLVYALFGAALVAVGNLALLVNLLRQAAQCCRACCPFTACAANAPAEVSR